MTEYIEKDYNECITKHRAKHFVCEFCNEHCSDEPCEPSDCEWMQYIDNEPAADVALVKHGRWVTEIDYDEFWGDLDYYKRSLCGDRELRDAQTPYCPNCGARMDGEQK